MESVASPLFLGGHPAVDFLNTRYGPDEARIETIGEGRALLGWLVSAGLIADEAAANKLLRRFGSSALDSTALEARKLREWTRDWLERWRVAPARDYDNELAYLNGMLARGTWRREVNARGRSLAFVDRVDLGSADALLALLASEVAALITNEDPSLLKQCTGTGCTLWFLDRSKAHRRVFCSATACGNRAKVAAFRERLRRR